MEANNMKSAGSIQRTGAQSFKLTISTGMGADGKRIRKTKNIKVKGNTEEAQQRNAKRQLAFFLSEVDRGLTSSAGSLTLHSFYNYWKENYAIPNHEKSTLALNEFLFTRIDAALGHKKLAQINQEHIILFLNKLSEPGVKKDPNSTRRKKTKDCIEEKLSSDSIRKHFNLLSSLLSQAQFWGMINANPCKRINPPKIERKPPCIYDEKTLGVFINYLKSEATNHQLMVSLALVGGLRREEIFGLCWQDVNYTESNIYIHQASIYVLRKIITKAPKNTGSIRRVSLPESTMDLLALHKKEQDALKLKLDNKWVDSGRIFTKWNGEPGHPHSFATWLTRFTNKHSLPHITPHKFRHMNATYLIMAGIDIRTVAGKLGHTKTSTTVDTYAQFVQTAEKGSANTMEVFLQGLNPTPEQKK